MSQLYGNEYDSSVYGGNRYNDALVIVRGELKAVNIAGKVYSDSVGASVKVTGNSYYTMNRITAFNAEGLIDDATVGTLSKSYLRLGKFAYTECIKDTDGNYIPWDGNYVDNGGYYIKPVTYMCYKHTDGKYYIVEKCVSDENGNYSLYNPGYKMQGNITIPTLYNCINVNGSYVSIDSQLSVIKTVNSVANMVYTGTDWLYKDITVSFNSNGSTSSYADSVVELNSSNTGYVVSLPEPTRDGFEFAGWYIGGIMIEEDGLIKLEYLTANTITLVARWTTDGYVINFIDVVGSKNGTNLNNYAGLDTMSVKYKDGVASQDLLASDHWKTNTSKQYYFSHYELADGTPITSYSYFDDKAEGNYTVYAIWIEKHLVTINIDTTGLTASNCYVKVNNTQYKSSTSLYVVNGESININIHARGKQSGGFFGIGAYDHRATITVENSLGTVTSGNLTAVTEETGKKSSDITKDVTITAASGGSTTITIKPIS